MIVILLTRNTTGLAKWLSVPLRTMVVSSDPAAATNVNVFKVTVFRQFLCVKTRDYYIILSFMLIE